MKKQQYQAANFVAPLDTRTRAEIVEVVRELPSAPITLPMPHSGHVDRAKGFSIATAPLAIVAGIVAAIAGIIGWRIPAASLVTLLLALGGFSVVWLIAYLGHVFVSADGALVIHTIMGWNYLNREAKERHKRYARLRAKDGADHE